MNDTRTLATRDLTDTVLVLTRRCPMCSERGELTMPAGVLDHWKAGGLIQVVAPDMPTAEREQLLSGLHPACQDELYGEDPLYGPDPDAR